MRNYILRIYFGPTLFQRFSSSTTVKWGATRIGFFAENGLFAPGSSVKNIRTQNKGLFVVSKKGTGQSCFTLLWLRNCPLAK
jgi:hypothetical protein